MQQMIMSGEQQFHRLDPDEAKLVTDYRELFRVYGGGRMTVDVRNGHVEAYEVVARQGKTLRELAAHRTSDQAKRLRD